MPFVHESEGWWRTGSTIDLRQLPERGRMTVRFELLDDLGYTTRPPDGFDPSGPTWSRSAVEHVVPAGFVTDLASVPELLWGVIASYGRQTLPAVLHDQLYATAARADTLPRARRLRRDADVLFRSTLRESGAGPVRQWLMWAAVRTFGTPLVVVPLVALAVVLLLLAVLWPAGVVTEPDIAWAAVLVAAAGLLIALLVTAVEEDDAGGVALRPRSFLSGLGASLIAVSATPLVVLVMLVTALVELGERSVPLDVHRRPVQVVSATARITWSPLLPRLPDGERRPVD